MTEVSRKDHPGSTVRKTQKCWKSRLGGASRQYKLRILGASRIAVTRRANSASCLRREGPLFLAFGHLAGGE